MKGGGLGAAVVRPYLGASLPIHKRMVYLAHVAQKSTTAKLDLALLL